MTTYSIGSYFREGKKVFFADLPGGGTSSSDALDGDVVVGNKIAAAGKSIKGFKKYSEEIAEGMKRYFENLNEGAEVSFTFNDADFVEGEMRSDTDPDFHMQIDKDDLLVDVSLPTPGIV